MKIDFDTPILDLKGKQVREKDGDKYVPLTLGDLAAAALLATVREDQGVSGGEKAQRFKLALKVESGEHDLSIDDIKKIKDRIGLACPTLYVGRAYEILDPEPAAFKTKAA